MKHIIYFILFVLNISIIQGQKFQCIKETQLTPAEQQAILMVYQDYIHEMKKVDNLVHIQYKSSTVGNIDSMMFIVYVVNYPSSLLELPADCYAEDSTNVIFLYTKNYISGNDSVWLKTLIEKGNERGGVQTQVINWSEKTYRITGDLSRFDAPLYYYMVVKGKIVTKELRFFQKLYTPIFKTTFIND